MIIISSSAGPPRRHGATLLEVLVSMTLLTVVLCSGAAWLRVAHRGAMVLQRSARQESALMAVLDRIGEDLVVGDFAPTAHLPGSPPRTNRPHHSRVAITEDGILEIETRGRRGALAGRPVRHRYHLDQVSHTLVRIEVSAIGSSADACLLAGDVRSFVSTAIEDPPSMTVTMTTMEGGIYTRTWSMP